MKTASSLFLTIISLVQFVYTQNNDISYNNIIEFGERGYYKMIYDRLQRSQAVQIDDEIHIVFNGGVNAHGLAKPYGAEDFKKIVLE